MTNTGVSQVRDELKGIKCRFDSAQHYYDALVAESAVNRLPAVDRYSCEYLTADGRQCGVGLLFTPADAGLLEKYLPGTVDKNRLEWAELLPPWLPVEDAERIQDQHDSTDAASWDHAEWVEFLNGLPAFAGVQQVAA